MTIPINMTLYRLLVKQGASEADAEDAARFDASDLVTKDYLKAELAALEARLTWRMVVMTGVFVAVVTALRIFT